MAILSKLDSVTWSHWQVQSVSVLFRKLKLNSGSASIKIWLTFSLQLMGSLALKFEQLIYPSLGTKISKAKPLDIVECSHPFSMSLRGGGQGRRLVIFFCHLVAEQQDCPLRQVRNQKKTLETTYNKKIQWFCCCLNTHWKGNDKARVKPDVGNIKVL